MIKLIVSDMDGCLLGPVGELPDDAKKEQEQISLLLTQDGFKKIIITKDAIAPLYNEDGVLVMGLFDFLLNEDSLDQ